MNGWYVQIWGSVLDQVTTIMNRLATVSMNVQQWTNFNYEYADLQASSIITNTHPENMNTGDENIVNDVYCLLLTILIVCKEVRNTFLLLSMSNVYSHDKQSFQSG